MIVKITKVVNVKFLRTKLPWIHSIEFYSSFTPDAEVMAMIQVTCGEFTKTYLFDGDEKLYHILQDGVVPPLAAMMHSPSKDMLIQKIKAEAQMGEYALK